jgi:hypothetical protein
VPRHRRFDRPGVLHHVFNRGTSKRPVFEERADVRFFLALLAREVRRGTIRVLAYAFLTTHFHLLLESLKGELSKAMRRVLNRYVRWFNRRRRRDGSLFRSRFSSRPVLTLAYRWTLLRYIHQNAPQARLSSTADTYPYCSAALYVAARRPRWLSTDWVDGEMARRGELGRREAYAAVFGAPLREDERFWVDERMRRPATDGTAESWDLIERATTHARARMRRKLEVADGQVVHEPPAAPGTVDRLVAERCGGDEDTASLRLRDRITREAFRIGALREVCGLAYPTIATRVGLSLSQVRFRIAQHRARLRRDDDYRRLLEELVSDALASARGSAR